MSTPSNWFYFSVEELRCRHCGKLHMDDTFMNKIVALRTKARFPFKISSGYRCPEYNDSISNTGSNGPHTTGHAIDIVCNSTQAMFLVENARDFGMTGIGINQRGDYSKRFVHLDDLLQDYNIGRNRPHIWTY